MATRRATDAEHTAAIGHLSELDGIATQRIASVDSLAQAAAVSAHYLERAAEGLAPKAKGERALAYKEQRFVVTGCAAVGAWIICEPDRTPERGVGPVLAFRTERAREAKILAECLKISFPAVVFNHSFDGNTRTRELRETIMRKTWQKALRLAAQDGYPPVAPESDAEEPIFTGYRHSLGHGGSSLEPLSVVALAEHSEQKFDRIRLHRAAVRGRGGGLGTSGGAAIVMCLHIFLCLLAEDQSELHHGLIATPENVAAAIHDSTSKSWKAAAMWIAEGGLDQEVQLDYGIDTRAHLRDSTVNSAWTYLGLQYFHNDVLGELRVPWKLSESLQVSFNKAHELVKLAIPQNLVDHLYSEPRPSPHEGGQSFRNFCAPGGGPLGGPGSTGPGAITV
ncbi:hypothetical protein JCM10213_003125 [Rhodosporidiobolus nylandii]